MKRTLIVANALNLLVAIYFLIISIISLVYLRWYHQLTVAYRLRNIIAAPTSYSAFVILLVEAIIQIIIFLTTISSFASKRCVTSASNLQDAINSQESHELDSSQQQTLAKQQMLDSSREQLSPKRQQRQQQRTNSRIDSKATQLVYETRQRGRGAACCATFLHLISSICLILIIIIWLLNTGELVRDSISSQLDFAYSKYQFSNRSNIFSVAVDGMQFINNCCGSLDYTDFPHQRISGLTSGHYPGSCCNKHTFGVNARVFCSPEEVVKAKQTTGCVTNIANFYDLVSLLIVPFSLISLFVSITIIALISSRGHNGLRQFSSSHRNEQSRLKRTTAQQQQANYTNRDNF